MQADDPGSNGVLAGTDMDKGGRVRGLKTYVDDELGVDGMDRSGKGRGENEKRGFFSYWFVTFFVRCRSHVLLLCLRWRERPNYRPQFRRARIRHWGYTGNPPALDKGSERIGNLFNPNSEMGMGSTRASGVVFRALAENFRYPKKSAGSVMAGFENLRLGCPSR